MNVRLMLACGVIGMTTLGGVSQAFGQSAQTPVSQAATRLDRTATAWDARTQKIVAAAIRQINAQAATNPIAAAATADRVKNTIRVTASKSVLAADRSQTATASRLSRGTDPERSLRILSGHHERFNAIMDARVEFYSAQIDAALASATGG